MKTVVEFELFMALVEGRLTTASRKALVDFVATVPDAGDLIPGAGGARKLRWVASGRGKSGGARIITYTHCPACKVYLITIYLKNERADLSREEIAQLYGIVKDLAYAHR